MKINIFNSGLVFKALKTFSGSSNSIANTYLTKVSILTDNEFSFTGNAVLKVNVSSGTLANWQLFQTTAKGNGTLESTAIGTLKLSIKTSSYAFYYIPTSAGSGAGYKFAVKLEGDIDGYFNAINEQATSNPNSPIIIIDTEDTINVISNPSFKGKYVYSNTQEMAMSGLMTAVIDGMLIKAGNTYKLEFAFGDTSVGGTVRVKVGSSYQTIISDINGVNHLTDEITIPEDATAVIFQRSLPDDSNSYSVTMKLMAL